MIAQQRMCNGQLEDEDQALLEPPTPVQDCDEGDIDNGEFWGDMEDNDCDNDLSFCDNIGNTQSSPNNSENLDQQEDQSRDAFTIATILTVMIARWSYRYNIPLCALQALLKLIRISFVLLSTLSSSFPSVIHSFLSFFPSSMYTFKRFIKVNENDFVKFVVCPSCHSLYNFEECFDTYGTRKKPKLCSFIAFPEHPHRLRRQMCGSRLIAEVILKSGKVQYYPRKYYCYKPISESLASLVKCANFLNNCELWRLRKRVHNTFCDIYDGKIWEDFQYINGTPFLATPHNLALMLNIDWFRPYKHTPYSVGAIYLVVTNLPRAERFRKENVILVGIIPGPSESPLHMNSYLKPMVDELNQLWEHGMQITSPDLPQPGPIILGFCGHMSRLGCSKCTKAFFNDPIDEKMNFGGFTECPMRNEHDHRKEAFLARDQKSAAARGKIEVKYGSRYTSLMELAYFDTVRCHVIDPMHNLFLGTAKYVTKNILFNQMNETNYSSLIQEKVDKCIVPSTFGRIPHKIASNCASFTADQWKAWTNVFSLYSLHGLLEHEHLKCWRLFVHASLLLSTPIITLEDAEKGHRLLLEFCNCFELLCGAEKVTPNMHLHMHILSCIKDYGPIYSFWLFSFERYNGLLGNYRTNQRSVELQLMRRFLSDLQIHDLSLPPCDDISEKDIEFLLPRGCVGTLKEVSSNHSEQYLKIVQACSSPSDFPSELWSFVDIYKLGGVMSTEILEEPELSCLAQSYCCMYPGTDYSGNTIPSTIYKYSQMKLGDEIYGSQNTRTRRSSYILARWCGRSGRIDTTCLRPARVIFYVKHSIVYQGSFVPHYFAVCQWFEEHPSRHLVGDPVELWCQNIYEQLGPASFLPVQRIQSKFVAGEGEVAAETVMFVMPLQKKVFL